MKTIRCMQNDRPDEPNKAIHHSLRCVRPCVRSPTFSRTPVVRCWMQPKNVKIVDLPISYENKGSWWIEGQITNGQIRRSKEMSEHAVIVSQVNFSPATPREDTTSSRSTVVTTLGCSNGYF